MVIYWNCRRLSESGKAIDETMIAYEFSWIDDAGEAHLIGTMPERRRDPERITPESIMKYGRTFLGDDPGLKDFFVTQVSIDEDTGEVKKVTSIPGN
jgi:hypothetical protein